MEPRIATLKNTASLLPLAACLFSLYSCGQGSGAKGVSTAIDTTAKTALAPTNATFDCINNNIEFRHKEYNLTEWAALRKDFDAHFKVELAGKNADINDPVLRIPWSSILAAQKTVAKSGKPVNGIYISYGLDGDRFHPIFEFMYRESGDPKDTNLLVFANAPFSFDGKDLKPEKDPKKFTDAYLNDLRVDRTGTGLSKLNETSGELDPLATWYPYEQKVNDLLAQNPVKDTVLVVSCVSKSLCYRALSAASAPEFRHLLTLHVADGTKDQLASGQPDPSKTYFMRAMDLGTMCPPNCPPKKP